MGISTSPITVEVREIIEDTHAMSTFAKERIHIPHVENAEEDVIWREQLQPLLGNLRPNVAAICNHGFTEIFNNVIDHSESESAMIEFELKNDELRIIIADSGVGIFSKLQRAFQLHDPRHALLELMKGKMTSDPTAHTGEGIFFTSKMFDKFHLKSGSLFFSRSNFGQDWLMEVEEKHMGPGTVVELVIKTNTDRTMQQVFDEFAGGDGDFSFARTHVPVFLARYGDEQLLSRSQAKRLLARFEQFDVVVLDFKEVEFIGQAFADEIFRVFANVHPDTEIVPINMSRRVEQMVRRSKFRQHSPTNSLAETALNA